MRFSLELSASASHSEAHSPSAWGQKLAQFLLFPSLALACACGGSTKESQSPEEAAASESSSSEGSGYGTSADEAPAGPNCDDGTCFPCGAGICPMGAYCDESAASGPACAWLPECSKTPTCACVTSVLGSSCSCQDAAGGPTVTCQ